MTNLIILEKANPEEVKNGWSYAEETLVALCNEVEQDGDQGLSLELMDDLLVVLDSNALLKELT